MTNEILQESILTIELLEKIQINTDNCKKIYRYFETEEDRENFCEGNIWLACPNQNRFIHEPKDPFEFRYFCKNPQGQTVNALFILTYTLSFSTELKLENKKYWIEISDIQKFLNQLKEDIPRNKHKVSWLNGDKIINEIGEAETINDYPSLIITNADVKNNPILINDTFLLELDGISADKVDYIDKSEFTQSSSEAVKKAFNKNIVFKHESEYRIGFQMTDFINTKRRRLENLVKHIMLKCPNTSKYIKPLSRFH